MSEAPPIVVTGSHRSGTTWVGRIMALSRGTGYIHEPLNPSRRPGWGAGRVPYWYLYVCSENAARWRPVFDDAFSFRYRVGPNLRDASSPRGAAWLIQDLRHAVPGRIRRARAVLKDPFALFSTEWLSETYDARIVITVRNPIAFVGSIKKLNWRFKFRTVLQQDLLMRDHLGGLAGEMRRCRDGDVDVVEEGIVLWNMIHTTVDRLRREHPEWAIVRHEDLAADPSRGFRDLYRSVGLAWDEGTERRLARFTSGSKGEVPVWQHMTVRRSSAATAAAGLNRLSEAEVERVRAGTTETARSFGYFLETE